MLTKHACSTTAHEHVVLKCAPEIRLQREKEILQQFAGDSYIRQLIDCGKETPFLVLEHFESDALTSSSEARISKQDIKFIARSILSALESLHGKGIAHTGKVIRFYSAHYFGLTSHVTRRQTKQHPSKFRQKRYESRGS